MGILYLKILCYKNYIMKILAIIPARGGSKSIPLKNIKKFCGKPLLAWSILAALKSGVCRVIVSTDNKQMAQIAKRYGAEVPFIRPAELATDTTPAEPVLFHAINYLKEKENYHPDAVILLQPTSPLRQPWHIQEAVMMFKNKRADSVVSVCEAIANQNPHWMLKKNNGKVTLFTGESIKKIKSRRQLLPVCYYRNDIVYVFKPENLKQNPPNLYGDKIELYTMDQRYDSDINTVDDWLGAEIKFKKIKKLTS